MSGGAWIGPTVEDTIRGLKAKGHRGVFLHPIGFLCDHVEVLYDIDIAFPSLCGREGPAVVAGGIFKRFSRIHSGCGSACRPRARGALPRRLPATPEVSCNDDANRHCGCRHLRSERGADARKGTRARGRSRLCPVRKRFTGRRLDVFRARGWMPRRRRPGFISDRETLGCNAVPGAGDCRSADRLQRSSAKDLYRCSQPAYRHARWFAVHGADQDRAHALSPLFSWRTKLRMAASCCIRRVP